MGGFYEKVELMADEECDSRVSNLSLKDVIVRWEYLLFTGCLGL